MVISATYTGPDGVLTDGRSHAEAAKVQGVTVPKGKKARETDVVRKNPEHGTVPEYGFKVQDPVTGETWIEGRQDARQTAEDSGQVKIPQKNINKPLHSNDLTFAQETMPVSAAPVVEPSSPAATGKPQIGAGAAPSELTTKPVSDNTQLRERINRAREQAHERDTTAEAAGRQPEGGRDRGGQTLLSQRDAVRSIANMVTRLGPERWGRTVYALEFAKSEQGVRILDRAKRDGKEVIFYKNGYKGSDGFVWGNKIYIDANATDPSKVYDHEVAHGKDKSSVEQHIDENHPVAKAFAESYKKTGRSVDSASALKEEMAAEIVSGRTEKAYGDLLDAVKDKDAMAKAVEEFHAKEPKFSEREAPKRKPVSDEDAKAAGFKDVADLEKSHAREGMKDVKETIDEYMRRIYCGGRKASMGTFG